MLVAVRAEPEDFGPPGREQSRADAHRHRSRALPDDRLDAMSAPETRDLLDEFILISRMEAPEQSPPAGAALVAEMTFGDVQTDYSQEPLVDVDARRNVRTVLRGADECVLELDIQHRGS